MGREKLEAGIPGLTLNIYQIVTFDILQGKQDSNPHRRFWRPLNYPCSIPLWESEDPRLSPHFVNGFEKSDYSVTLIT